VSYLLDTNTVSELMKPLPEASVLSWLEAHESECFLSAVTVGEVEKGIALLPAGRKKSQLQEFFRFFMRTTEERVLSFDVAVAQRWALLTSTAQRKGRTLSAFDSMIEATALHWDLTLITRNVSDFIEVPKINPWPQQKQN
jgi:predicted nucleic acid-binding protein